MSEKEKLYVVSVSGGKDSTACALHVQRELGLPCRFVFADTGWEAAETYRHIETLEKHLGPIDRVRAEETFQEVTRRKLMFPWRGARWCTDHMKVRPIMRYIGGLLEEGSAEVVNVVGVRREESAKRATYTAREWNADLDCEVWRPILDWSLRDVVECHKRHGVPMNPLYHLGAERVGCWPCIFASKNEIRLVAEHDPQRIDEIRELERHIAEEAAAIGKETHSQMFSLREPGSTKHVGVGIDAKVEWSRTARGGQQQTLLRPTGGCARWGFCEVPHEEKE